MQKESITPEEQIALEERKQKLVKNIQENYRQVERSIVNQLYMKHNLHGSTIGSTREDIWQQLFEMIIPKKFVIEKSVFIIDSEGKVSREVDLAILDEMYTPYIFRYGRLKFIPIEAVAVVVECKSKSLNGVGDWYESISDLTTANDSIARIATMIAMGASNSQKSTHPIRILCTLQSEVKREIADKFDFVLLAAKDETERIEIRDNVDSNLQVWFRKLNFHKTEPDGKISNEECIEEIELKEYEVRDEGKNLVSLLTFNFQLNQLLMLINNPMYFPHRAYAKLFNTGGQDF